jgi:hypothetical protein
MRERLSAFAIALVLTAAAPAAAGELETFIHLSPERIGLSELAKLEIEARRSGFGRLRFEPLFELENLELVAGPFEVSETSSVNGSFSRSLRLTWQLRPLATGRARVHSVRLRLGGEVVALPERAIEVQVDPTGLGAPRREERRRLDPWERFFGGSPFARGREEGGPPRVFLRAEVEPERPYVGQQAVYTLFLYTQDDVDAIQPKSLPEFRGFWVRDLPAEQHLPTEMVEVEGARYGRVALLRKAIFPLRPGPHELAPAAMELVVRVLERRFFGPPLARPEGMIATSPRLLVHVRPLPPPPPGFGGAVGSLALAARLEPRELAVGEAATLTLTLSGAGNLQGVHVPELPERRHLELFPPQQQGGEEVRGTTVLGKRTWSWVLVPERAGRYPLRLPEVPYFDPQSATYRLASAPVLELVAHRAPAEAGAMPVRLHSIRSAALPLGPAHRLEGLLPWLFALPCAAALAIVLARRRNGVAGGDGGPAPARKLSRRVGSTPRSAFRRAPSATGSEARQLAQRLREAEAEARPRQAAARIEEAWRVFLAARWELPPGTPSTTWAERLAAGGADGEAAAELVRLADDLHYLRYAPQLSATEALQREAVERSRRLLRRLR